MRKMKQLLGVLLSILLINTMYLPVKAAETGAGTGDYPDTYTIRIYAGQQGTMTECTSGRGHITEDGRMFVLDGLEYGKRINVSYTMVKSGSTISGGDAQGTVSGGDVSGGDGSTDITPTDPFNYFVLTVEEVTESGVVSVSKIDIKTESKYNMIGARESGKDNSERIGSRQIECDSDYVIAYGLMKDAVEYTINYLDADGNPLYQSDTYYGSIGDKPVVSYRYFDGYQPQAYNLTKTLSANAAENVFNFRYTRVPAPGVSVITIPGAPGPEGTPGEDTIITIPGGGGGGAPVPPAPDEGGGGGGVNIPDEPIPEAPTPDEKRDLDVEDDAIPQGEFNGEDGKTISIPNGNAFLVNVPLPAKILAVIALVVILGGGIWWFVKARMKKKEDAEDAEASNGTGNSDGAGHSGKKPEGKA